MEFVAYMALQDLLLPLLCFNISLLDAMLYYGTINNTIRMEPLPILVVQYLTWHDSCLGLALGFLHALTPE
jgi:hypothetical protein